MNTTNPRLTAESRAGLEARFALRVAAHLDRGSRLASHDIDERLRVAREQALARARAARSAAAASETSVLVTGVSAGVAVLGGGSPSRWFRAAALLPLALLVAGLFLIDQRLDEQQSAAVAEIDNALLSDALPPSAYTDPAFLEFLKADPQ